MNESVWAILGSPAHWIAEIIVTLVFDGLMLGIFWPMVRNCWQSWRREKCALNRMTPSRPRTK